MKYKVLLAGRNQATIDDFFYTLCADFECMTTSIRSMDIVKHVEYFQPDVFVYCFMSEEKEEIPKLVTALEPIERRKLKFIIIGDTESCNEFLRVRSELVNLTLLKPITASSIKTQIISFIEEQKLIEAQEKERLEKERLEKERLEKERLEKEKQEAMLSSGKEDGEPVKKHILVIDDDPIMLRIIKEELRDEYNVATAVSGKIGMSFLTRKMTNMILLDYEMPEESGAEVLEKIRANDRLKDIPVVFLTGINDREKIQKVLAMKPQGYLLKPIDHEKLVQTIRKVIG